MQHKLNKLIFLRPRESDSFHNLYLPHLCLHLPQMNHISFTTCKDQLVCPSLAGVIFYCFDIISETVYAALSSTQRNAKRSSPAGLIQIPVYFFWSQVLDGLATCQEYKCFHHHSSVAGRGMYFLLFLAQCRDFLVLPCCVLKSSAKQRARSILGHQHNGRQRHGPETEQRKDDEGGVHHTHQP